MVTVLILLLVVALFIFGPPTAILAILLFAVIGLVML